MLIRKGQCIGFVPTMGYLHEGHLSLIRRAREKADAVVLSIFVNPTQFGPGEDLEQCPRDLARDEALAEEEGVDIIFYPSSEEMYPDGYLTSVQVDKLTGTLCGASRPLHFKGVTTICAKLFHAVKPHFAVFGQKDYQQSVVIRRMAEDLNFDLEIVVAPIVRESDGLAMSSRNTYLSDSERDDALSLNESLVLAGHMVQEGETRASAIIEAVTSYIKSKSHTRMDYIKIVHPDTLEDLEIISGPAVMALAVFVGKTRLIDNAMIKK